MSSTEFHSLAEQELPLCSSADENAPVVWDRGRMLVIPVFSGLLQRHGLTTFDSVYESHSGEIAKNVLKERVTMRLELGDGQALYLKRHGPAPLREYFKAWIRFRLPLIGARNEWKALCDWRKIGLPTQTPVAYGKSGRRSFLLTVALEECDKLSYLFDRDRTGVATISPRRRHSLTRSMAGMVRRMHDLGWHHQDCYSGHFLIRKKDHEVFLIDLGRTRKMGLLRNMWIRKDLAQLAYSFRGCTLSDQFRFLRTYWGRPFRVWERRWLRKILRKVRAIARHAG